MSSPIQATSVQTTGATFTAARSAPKRADSPAETEPNDVATITGRPATVARAAPTPTVAPSPMPTATMVTDANGTTTVHFVYDDDKRDALKNLTLMGSWDKTGTYTTEWKDSAVKMKDMGDGRYEATVKLNGKGDPTFQWGVKADGPSGDQQWAMFGENPPSFQAQPGQELTETYKARTYAQTGVTKDGDDANIRFWAPKAESVSLKVWDKMDQDPKTINLTQDQDGYWNGQAKGQWSQLDGKSYGFDVTNADGTSDVKTDPYARQLQGQLRGVGDLYLNPNDGSEVNQYWTGKAPDGTKQVPTHFYRFEVQQQPDADQVKLRLYDQNGDPLSKAALEKRLGTTGGDLVHNYEGEKGSYWDDNVSDDGAISLHKAGSDAWNTNINNPAALQGLTYRFEVWKNGALVGDTNHDGKLSEAEAQATPWNDPYENTIKDIDSQRLGVIKSDDYDWKNQSPNIPRDKAIVYQLHVGSFMGDDKNERRSTFKDLIDKIDYFKDLGVNTIEMLPTNPFEGQRDWGYIGTSSTAVAEQYGFVDKNGKWVSGPDALKRFVDIAHGQGLNVVDDVVYNHWGGDYDSQWNVDGKANSAFDWGNGLKNTDWGAMPAYDKNGVRNLIIDSATSRLDDFHEDGLRFDFTAPIHQDGSGGGKDGWTLLRDINRETHFFHPGTTTQAENFPNEPIITQPAGSNMTGGAGFDTVWNTEYQHRLVHGQGDPSVAQQAVLGQKTDMDRMMDDIVNHPGFANPENATTVISNHDEVGNADRTINVLRNFKTDGVPNAWERGMARATFGTGMLSPGMPMFFQGEESLADNPFKWGIPSTWDTGWDWKDKDIDVKGAAQAVSEGKAAQFAASEPSKPTEEDLYRRLHFEFSKDAIALRKSSPAFDAEVPAQRVYTHNDNSVMAFSRQSGNDQFLVVTSLNKNDQPGYNIPLGDGKWQLVLDSDAEKYGGSGMGTQTVQGGQQAKMDLPAGSVLVYKKVG